MGKGEMGKGRKTEDVVGIAPWLWGDRRPWTYSNSGYSSESTVWFLVLRIVTSAKEVVFVAVCLRASVCV